MCSVGDEIIERYRGIIEHKDFITETGTSLFHNRELTPGHDSVSFLSCSSKLQRHMQWQYLSCFKQVYRINRTNYELVTF